MSGQPGAWALPAGAGVQVLLVETEGQLDEYRQMLEEAVCCGIDAEWPPEETATEARSGGPPCATLVQLALWLLTSSTGASAGKGSVRSSSAGSCCVLLLDMMRLPQAAAKKALQQLFRNRGCLKLGFGLVHDLRAMAAALGSEGGSCIAVVEPACDLGSVHRFLRHHRAPGVHKAIDLGLSGLIEAQLGSPLDKQLQCSAWGKRPLAQEQLQYAASDAACLLALLGSLVVGVGQPEEWPMGTADEAALAAVAATAAAEPASSTAPGPGEDAAAVGEAAAAGEAAANDAPAGDAPTIAAAAAAAAAAQTGHRRPQQSQGPREGAAADGQPHSLLEHCSVQQLQAAAAAWGVRLEISGARAVKRRGGKARRQQRQSARGRGSGGGDSLPGDGFPLHVPWWGAQQQATSTPRFLCDVMAEGLARQLRLCGFDAESLASMEKAPRHTIYRVMVERAVEEQRVVLTKDRVFVAGNYSDQAFLVRADTKRQQLEEVLHAFELNPQKEDLLSRCARCNGEFLPEPVPAGLLPEGHDVPPGIQEQHAEFWVCGRCSGVFWQGGQYGRAVQQMTELMTKMAVGQPGASISSNGS